MYQRDFKNGDKPPTLSSVAGELQQSAILLEDPRSRAEALEKFSEAVVNLSLLPSPDLEHEDEQQVAQLEMLAKTACHVRDAAKEAWVRFEPLAQGLEDYFNRISSDLISPELKEALGGLGIELTVPLRSANRRRSLPSRTKKLPATKKDLTGNKEVMPVKDPVKAYTNLYEFAISSGKGLSVDDLSAGKDEIIKIAIERLPAEAKANPSDMLRLLHALISVGKNHERRNMVIGRIMELQQKQSPH